MEDGVPGYCMLWKLCRKTLEPLKSEGERGERVREGGERERVREGGERGKREGEGGRGGREERG